MVSPTMPYEDIIWSADVAGDGAVLTKLHQIDRPVRVKIDRLFVRRYGDAIFGTLKHRNIEVFNDAKLVEVGSKLEELALAEIELTRPWMLNCMAGSVSTGQRSADKRDELDGLKRFAEVCLKADVLPCAVTVLTSKTPDIVDGEFNGRKAIEQVLWYVGKLVEFGFTDVVCSPHEAAAIRAAFPGMHINTPSIRRKGDAPDDQARNATPAEARSWGANRVVVGRPITKAVDPTAVVDEIAADLQSAA